MQHNLGFNVRPAKFAYFIDDNDLEAFSEVASFCCSQWGGIHNFIIPVGEHGIAPFFIAVLKAHVPDFVVNRCGVRVAQFRKFLDSTLHAVSVHDWDHFDDKHTALHPLDLYREPGTEGQQAGSLNVYLSGESDPLLSACCTTAFGRIWPGQEAEYWKRFYPNNFDAKVPDIFLRHQLLNAPLSSPLNLTSIHIAAYYVAGSAGGIYFDVVVPGGPLDLCLFWDARAIKNSTQALRRESIRRTLLVPLSMFRQAGVRRTLFEMIRPGLVDAWSSSTFDINIIGRGTEKRPLWEALRRSQRNGEISPLQGPVTFTTTGVC